jgi:hypothetical protein
VPRHPNHGCSCCFFTSNSVYWHVHEHIPPYNQYSNIVVHTLYSMLDSYIIVPCRWMETVLHCTMLNKIMYKIHPRSYVLCAIQQYTKATTTTKRLNNNIFASMKFTKRNNRTEKRKYSYLALLESPARARSCSVPSPRNS